MSTVTRTLQEFVQSLEAHSGQALSGAEAVAKNLGLDLANSKIVSEVGTVATKVANVAAAAAPVATALNPTAGTAVAAAAGVAEGVAEAAQAIQNPNQTALAIATAKSALAAVQALLAKL